tara:strand:- start:322 stop:666 length:345 start_codon:yes stop_codon:yes gene_type:complete
MMVAALVGIAAAQSNIAGTWEGEATPSAGGTPNTWTQTLEQDGIQVTGSYVDAVGANAQVTGTLSGNQARLVLQFEGFAVTANFIVDGDEWTMCTYSSSVNDEIQGTCSGTRAQ